MNLVVERLLQLGIVRVSRWCFNCYLVDADEGWMVVDAGLPDVADDLAPLLAEVPGRSRIVTATHGHPDHVGGAAVLAHRYGAQIHVPAKTLSYLDGAPARTPTVTKLARTWPLLFGQPFDANALRGFVRATAATGFGTSRGMVWRGVQPSGGLEDGAPLPGASSWTVVNSPGHTDDSISFWHEGSRTLLSGDAVITMRARPRFAPDTVDDDANMRTRARLSALPVEHLLPGHGLPVHAGSVWEQL